MILIIIKIHTEFVPLAAQNAYQSHKDGRLLNPQFLRLFSQKLSIFEEKSDGKQFRNVIINQKGMVHKMVIGPSTRYVFSEIHKWQLPQF